VPPHEIEPTIATMNARHAEDPNLFTRHVFTKSKALLCQGKVARRTLTSSSRGIL
jgi:hypothetical protein